ASLRAFHRANYRVGPGLELVAALPSNWSVDEFLTRLNSLLAPLAPAEPTPSPAVFPPFKPAPAGEIRISGYPSTSPDAPQDVLLGWNALPELTADEWAGLEVLLSVIGGGETSYLYEDLLSQKSHSSA